jgi:hypothetical protein
MIMPRNLLCVVLVMAVCGCLPAQDHAGSVKAAAVTPSVTFSLDRPALEPHYYTISVDAIGRGSYQIAPAQTGESGVSKGSRVSQDSVVSEGAPEIVTFTMDPATVRHVFELARQTDYFRGDFDYRKHRIADTGSKTLAYADASRAGRTAYNWSENSAIAELTRIFTGVAATLDFAPRLEYLLAHDKLGLDQELGNMERLAVSGELAELQIVAPVLQRIAADTSVMNVARERARRLLQHAGLPLSASSQP